MGESFIWGSPFLVFFLENDKFRNNKSSESISRINTIIIIGQEGDFS